LLEGNPAGLRLAEFRFGQLPPVSPYLNRTLDIMTQRELDRAVARATGDDLTEIRRLGFSVPERQVSVLDPHPVWPPQTIDWDALESWRRR
jgi:hypothetical protein